jgi:hypothetical protein
MMGLLPNLTMILCLSKHEGLRKTYPFGLLIKLRNTAVLAILG